MQPGRRDRLLERLGNWQRRSIVPSHQLPLQVTRLTGTRSVPSPIPCSETEGYKSPCETCRKSKVSRIARLFRDGVDAANITRVYLLSCPVLIVPRRRRKLTQRAIHVDCRSVERMGWTALSFPTASAFICMLRQLLVYQIFCFTPGRRSCLCMLGFSVSPLRVYVFLLRVFCARAADRVHAAARTVRRHVAFVSTCPLCVVRMVVVIKRPLVFLQAQSKCFLNTFAPERFYVCR